MEIPLPVVEIVSGTRYEVEIKAYRVFQRPDMAKRLCMGDILMGLSMRNYEAVAERFLEGYGIKKSSLSMRYIRA